MTPFETFFAGEFQRRLEAVRGEPGLLSNGGRLEDASWDRKAAYLLWLADLEARGGYTQRMTEEFSEAQFAGDDDLIGGAPAAPAQQEDDEDLIG